MKSHVRQFALAAALLGLVLFAGGGCSQEKSTNSGDVITPEDQTIDLNAPNGGFLALDEQPAFGDAGLTDQMSREEQSTSGYDGLSIIQIERIRELERNHPLYYALTAVWGDLRNGDAGSIDEPIEGAPYTWDGAMVLDHGAIRLLGLIDFERPEDGIVPRAVPDELDWISVTHGDRDGLRVLIIVPQDAAPTDTLHFRAGDFARDIPTAALDGLNETSDVTDSLQISLRAVRADPAVSATGFIGGTWGWAVGDSVGRFEGVWVRAGDARVEGVLRGFYGVNARDQQVFFAKYIDVYGHFRGIIRGTWVSITEGTDGTPDFSETGTFTGTWVDEAGKPLGELNGQWTRRGTYTGTFTGVWRALGLIS